MKPQERANAIRTLSMESMDGVQKANSGVPTNSGESTTPMNPGISNNRLNGIIASEGIAIGKTVIHVAQEFAGDEQAALILAGMGLDEFGMSAPSVLKIKKVLINQNCTALAELARQCLNAPDADEVRRIVAAFSG
ncbi:putative PEP-binding protein [Endozoicomonas sp. ONNA2]|uniref:putative PEP-binding protein n=1 Tax=Endozoicomonas sp. ONNA2 TaxID=2828741 RepID=UPI00214910DF|nr:putative PEP-binding protein [Endozoicomonas sp. ONNA2]